MTTDQTVINHRAVARNWKRRQIFAAHPKAPDPSLVQEKGLPVDVWKRLEVDPDSGCWLWLGSLSREGYGRTRHGAKGTYSRVHRVTYELLVGPIPAELELDHLCRVRNCCNPEHLDPVTHQENLMRGATVAARAAAATHCPQGHAYAGTNLGVKGTGARWCRQCDRDYKAARRAAA